MAKPYPPAVWVLVYTVLAYLACLAAVATFWFVLF